MSATTMPSLMPLIARPRVRAGFEAGLAVCVFLFLPLLALASRGVAALAGVAGILALGVAAPAGLARWRELRGVALPLAALVLWGALSALWAVEPHRALLIALRLTGLFAAGLALMAAAPLLAAPQRLLRYFCAGLAVALVLAAVQHGTSGLLTEAFYTRGFIQPRLNQVENGFALLLLPLTATLVLRRRLVAAALLAAATVVVIYALVGTAAKTGFTAGVIAAVPMLWARRTVARIAAVVSVLVILAAPFGFPALIRIDDSRQWAESIKGSAWHRLEIWAFVGARIAERPVLGWGLDSSRAIPGGSDPTPEGAAVLPLHPHNVPLQLWLELGVPGATLLAWFVGRLWLALGRVRWPPLYAAAAGGSLVSALLVSLAGYGAWQEWWIGTQWLTLFLILVMARLAAQPMPKARTGSIS